MASNFPVESTEEIVKIREEVEKIKHSLQFNETIADIVSKRLRRFGFQSDDGKMQVAITNIETIIAHNINPNIQKIVLQKDLSQTKRTFYLMPKPRSKYKDNNTIPLFDEPQLIEEMCDRIVMGIYGNSSKDLIAIKSVAIRNLVKHTFWADVRYFLDEKLGDELFVDIGMDDE